MFKIRKLIEDSQKTRLICDNPKCDFTIDNPKYNIDHYINLACPDCGENLLTQADYDQVIRFYKVVRLINKWFSWLTLFMKKPEHGNLVKVHFHEGVKFNREK